jgi:DNA-binding IclR family transcriptional regulator
MEERYNIQVLERAFSIMDVLLQARTPLTLEIIATRTQMPKSTAFRIISNLIRHDYMCETDDGYWLGLKMLSFGQAVDERLDVRSVAAPYLSSLRDTTNETVYLATLTQDWTVMYLDKYPSRQLVGVTLHAPGMTIEMYCTGLGKVLAAYRSEADVRAWLQNHELTPHTPNTITTPEAFLAELQAIRQRGYGVDNAERSLSIRCVAAPIRNSYGKVIAAISVAGPAERMMVPLIDSEMAYLALETAQKISAALGMPVLPSNGTHRSEEVSQ